MDNLERQLNCRCAPCGGSDIRCDCNALLARVENGKLALKCKRCKRIVTIPMNKTGTWSEVRFER